MKSNLLLLGACALLVGGRAHAQNQVVTQNHRHTYEATPVWADEFDGTAVNPANWKFEGTDEIGRVNNELQYYQKNGANAWVANGKLSIQARKEAMGGYQYTSARLVSKGLQNFTYGKIEALIEVPLSNGMWPAFWMLGANEPTVGWPRCGEIDIMERVNTSGTLSSTQHWYDASVNRPGAMPGHVFAPEQYNMPSAGGYHKYTIEWDDVSISTWVDGVKYHEFPTNGVVNLASPGSNLGINQTTNATEAFKKPYYLLLNLAVGGDMAFNQWTNVWNVDESKLPGIMNVEYVKVFKQSTGTPPPATGVATMYKDFNYGGYAIPLPVGNYTMANLQARGILNDDVSSLKVGSGYQAVLYEGDNFMGASLTITADNSSLGNVPLRTGTWNDVTSSVRIQAATTPPPSSSSQLLEAENANVKSGMTAEACSEGGQNMGYIQAGGFLTFNNINFPTTGTYLIEYRVASGGAGGTISCDLNAGTIPLGATTIPGTGGWQNWTTVSRTVSVNAGTYNFGVYAQTAGYNLNWIRITPQSAPQQLEAENASVKSGMTAEACSEGGQDMGYIQAGGFLTFNNINFPTTGTYLIEYRVASGGTGGTVSCDLNGGSIYLGPTTIPGTGGWQNWTTVSRTVSVNAGTYNFGVYAQTGGYNINWIRITKQGAARGVATATAVNAAVRGAQPLQVYPNPATTSFVVDGLREAGELTLRDYLGRTCLHKQVEANERIDISTLPVGIYVLTVRTAEGQLVQKLVKQ
ncbi:carbohydrate-binding protein [Hymenobacter glaciei]